MKTLNSILKNKNLILMGMFIFLVLIGLNLSADNNDDKKSIKIALLLDTSNSMDGLIEQAKSQLWTIVNELAGASCDGERPELQIALYEYGNDWLSAHEGYIRQVTYLTKDLDLVSQKLFELRTNGGSEFCGQVINTSLDQLVWNDSNEDLKLIFLLHSPYLYYQHWHLVLLDFASLLYQEFHMKHRYRLILYSILQFYHHMEMQHKLFYNLGLYSYIHHL